MVPQTGCHTASPQHHLGCVRVRDSALIQPNSEEMNQPACSRNSRPGVPSTQTRNSSLLQSIIFPFPIQISRPSPPTRKVKDFTHLESGFVSAHYFLKIFPRNPENVSPRRAKFQNSQRGTDLICKFFQIQHERSMETGLLGDILSAMKLKKLS